MSDLPIARESPLVLAILVVARSSATIIARDRQQSGRGVGVGDSDSAHPTSLPTCSSRPTSQSRSNRIYSSCMRSAPARSRSASSFSCNRASRPVRFPFLSICNDPPVRLPPRGRDRPCCPLLNPNRLCLHVLSNARQTKRRSLRAHPGALGSPKAHICTTASRV